MKHSIRKRLIALSCIAMAVILLLGGIVSYRKAYNREMEEAQDTCMDSTMIARQMIDEAGYDALCKPGNTELYSNTRNSLRALCIGFDLQYLYMYTVDEAGLLHYVFVVATDDEILQMFRDLGTEVDDELYEQEKAALRGEGSEFFIIDNQFGRNLAWPSTYYGEDGEIIGIIGAEISVNVSNELIMKQFLDDCMWIVLWLLCTFVALFLIIRKNVIKPLLKIAGGMESFDPSEEPKPLGIHSDDEMKKIADSFEKMSLTIRDYISNIEDFTAQQEKVKANLMIARRIQNGMVPVSFRESSAVAESSALMQPAIEVGGDFYDCFILPDGCYCALIGDVSGKGVAGALFMAQVKSLLRDRLRQGMTPAEALNRVNDELCASNPEGLFVTVFACALEPDGVLHYANAGHNPPVLIRGGSAVFLEPDPGIALGLFEDSGIKNVSIQLNKGEGMLLYTDGITEAVDPAENFFGPERLLATAVEHSADSDICEAVKAATEEFAAGREQFDDITVVMLRYTGGVTDRGLPVSLGSFDTVKETVISLCPYMPDAKKVLLACDEALTNIVSYSGATELWFSCARHGNTMEVVFRDNGTEFDPLSGEMLPDDRDFEDFDQGGMGISLIRQTAPDSVWERKDGCNVLTLRFTLHEDQ